MRPDRRLYLRVRLVLLVALGMQRPLCPQANFGRISGTVSDSSGAVLPKTEVRVVNEGTGVERAANSNEGGAYVVTNLPVGIYTVRVEVAGFQAAARTGLNLVADGRLTVDFALQPAGISQSVDVIAARGEAMNLV